MKYLHHRLVCLDYYRQPNRHNNHRRQQGKNRRRRQIHLERCYRKMLLYPLVRH
jgi:hypothetical protein